MRLRSTGTSTSSSPGSKERADSNADGVEEFYEYEITDDIQHDRDGLDGDGTAHLGGGGGVTVHQDDDKEDDEQ